MLQKWLFLSLVWVWIFSGQAKADMSGVWEGDVTSTNYYGYEDQVHCRIQVTETNDHVTIDDYDQCTAAPYYAGAMDRYGSMLFYEDVERAMLSADQISFDNGYASETTGTIRRLADGKLAISTVSGDDSNWTKIEGTLEPVTP